MESTTLVKAFGLLEATAGLPQGRTLGELAAAVGLTKPTAHRLLKTLATLGYVERVGAGVYRQTTKIRRLITPEPDRPLVELAMPLLRALSESTGETVNLGVLRHGSIVYLAVLESTQPLRRVATPESTDPFYCTALGRAIVAHLSADQRRLLLRSMRPEARTPHTVVDRQELIGIVERVRAEGFAIEQDQTDLGVTCIGAPVFDGKSVVAAISLSLPTVRAEARRQRLVEAVCSAAAELSRRLAAQSSEADPTDPAPTSAAL